MEGESGLLEETEGMGSVCLGERATKQLIKQFAEQLSMHDPSADTLQQAFVKSVCQTCTTADAANKYALLHSSST